MGIVEQRVGNPKDGNGIYIRFTNGKEITLTLAQIKNMVTARPTKKIAMDSLKQQIVSTSPDLISSEEIYLSIDSKDMITLVTADPQDIVLLKESKEGIEE